LVLCGGFCVFLGAVFYLSSLKIRRVNSCVRQRTEGCCDAVQTAGVVQAVIKLHSLCNLRSLLPATPWRIRMKLLTIPQRRCAALAGLVSLVSLTAAQAQTPNPDWYIGFGIGETTYHIENADLIRTYLGNNIQVLQLQEDDQDTAFKAFGGYQFTDYFALEWGYFDLGESTFFAELSPTESFSGTSAYRGVHLDTVFSLQLSPRLSTLASLGISEIETKNSFYSDAGFTDFDSNYSERNTVPEVGLGVQFQMNPSLAVRAQAERFWVKDAVDSSAEADVFTLGLVYRFGQVESPAPAPVPTPEPVALPAPVEKNTDYCALLDIEYEIAKDSVQNAEKEKLAVLGTFLKKYPETEVIIEGHTDSVGDAAKNMALSQRRAQSVVDYLIAEFGISPSRLTATGFGEDYPIVDNATEAGKRRNRRINAIISCATDIAGLNPMPARMSMALVIPFAHNQADIAPMYHNELAKLAQLLTQNPTVTATVEGHTADTTPEKAENLSQARAQAVVDYLVKRFAIAPSRLRAQGFGQSRRTAYNSSAQGRQDNRRVMVVLSYP
jgi:OmpA-OmpF porin, OOP family